MSHSFNSSINTFQIYHTCKCGFTKQKTKIINKVELVMEVVSCKMYNKAFFPTAAFPPATRKVVWRDLMSTILLKYRGESNRLTDLSTTPRILQFALGLATECHCIWFTSLLYSSQHSGAPHVLGGSIWIFFCFPFVHLDFFLETKLSFENNSYGCFLHFYLRRTESHFVLFLLISLTMSKIYRITLHIYFY